MLRILISLCIAACATLAIHGALADADAQPADPAGSGSGIAAAGSAVAPAPSAPVQTVTPVDPTSDPKGFINAMKDAKAVGWPVAVALGAWGLLTLLAKGASEFSKLAFLKSGRAAIAVAGLLAVLTAAIAAATRAGSWSAVAGALVASALAFVNFHAPTPDPKA